MADQPTTVQPTPCRHCREHIPEGATVCSHCKKSQGWLLSKWESVAPFIPVLPIILSVALVTLSWQQFLAASAQRTSADRAATLAHDALTQAEAARVEAQRASVEATLARDEAKQARDEIRGTEAHLRTMTKLKLELDMLTPTIVEESYDPVKADKVRQQLEGFAFPNEAERAQWRKKWHKPKLR